MGFCRTRRCSLKCSAGRIGLPDRITWSIPEDRLPDPAFRSPCPDHQGVFRKRVVNVRTEIAAGTQVRVNEELQRLGYHKPNTSAVERQNATARRMNPHLARKSLAFARLRIHRESLAHLVQDLQLVPSSPGSAEQARRPKGTSAVPPAHTGHGHRADQSRLEGAGLALTAAGRLLSGIVPANYPRWRGSDHRQ